jgi:PilZ domain
VPLDADRRAAPRASLVLAAEVIELPRGAKLAARTADVCRIGCYVDTLNPILPNSQVRLRLTHNDQIFEALGRVIYVSPGLGMGLAFENVAPDQQAMLDHWLSNPTSEF